MQYEIRVWNDPDKMPNLEPKAAQGRLAAIAGDIQTAINGNKGDNPDIWIEKDGAGDDAIKTVDISFELADVSVSSSADVKVIRTVRIIKIYIKGNLYLPINGSLENAAKSMAGLKTKQENEKKNTLRLSEWAQLQPDAPKDKGYYRGITISVLTKAGDFRIIQANNVYVESYKESYNEGEFGTFEIYLTQRADATSKVQVKGLKETAESVMDQIKGAVSKAANTAGKVAAVVGTVGVVGKVASNIGTQVVTTVETFTGETEASKRAKQAMGIIGNTADATSSTGNIIKSAATEKDKNKKAQDISKELEKISKNANDSVKDGYKTNVDIAKLDVTKSKVKKMEDTYYDKLTNQEKAVYEKLDDAGKLQMLVNKKGVLDKQTEIDKNQAILDELKK